MAGKEHAVSRGLLALALRRDLGFFEKTEAKITPTHID